MLGIHALVRWVTWTPMQLWCLYTQDQTVCHLQLAFMPDSSTKSAAATVLSIPDLPLPFMPFVLQAGWHSWASTHTSWCLRQRCVRGLACRRINVRSAARSLLPCCHLLQACAQMGWQHAVFVVVCIAVNGDVLPCA
jgi:hypothetical protein